MPEEIYDINRFILLSGRAKYCTIKRLSKSVKFKLRAPRKLYSLKVNPEEAEGIVKKLRCEIVEV